ncbi:MAG: hypothetical protein JW759_10075 [Candidatus Coatesbacteria bacterium]|nr:hypothetical protein [Candidatus Coatesbacteria bacterium]
MAKGKDEKDETPDTDEQPKQAGEEVESYGWEYHKVTLLIAVTLSAIFYILIWIFIE